MRFFVYLLAALVTMAPAAQAQTVDARMAGETSQPAPSVPVEITRGFSQKDREAVYGYFKLPPAQQSIREDIRAKEHMGPGSLVGSRLAANIALSDLPVRLARKLAPPKTNVKFGSLGVDLIAMDINSREILDFVPNVIPEYTR